MKDSLIYRLLNGVASPSEIIDGKGGGGVSTDGVEALEEENRCLFQGRFPLFA
jgi:hypothetical protein